MTAGIVSDSPSKPTGPLPLAGHLIVVTGARGLLGSSWSRQLAWEGATVLALDTIRPVTGMGVHYAGRGQVRHEVADTTSEESLRAWLKLGTPHGLVCAAGIDAKPENDGSDPWRGWERILHVNLTGTALACKVFGGAMAERGGGSIVLVSSVYGVVGPDPRIYADGFTKPLAYPASKSAVIGLTKALAALWGPFNVRVNALVPGGVQTESSPAAFVGQYARKVPLGRMGGLRDCAGALVYLLSDASDYVTGTTITVDGGYSAW